MTILDIKIVYIYIFINYSKVCCAINAWPICFDAAPDCCRSRSQD